MLKTLRNIHQVCHYPWQQSNNFPQTIFAMKIQLVVFDLAGTTVKDSRDVHHVLQQSLYKHDVHITLEDANDVMGLPKPVAIRMLLNKRYERSDRITEEFVDEIHRLFVREMIWFYQTNPAVGEKEGVTETFKKLRERGIKVGIDTGFSRQIIQPLLERLGWIKNNLIDCSVTSDEVKRGRPHPDLIFEVMKQTGVIDSKRVMKVGDTASDIQEGKAAGCGITVGVTSGAFTAEALMHEKPTNLIHSIPEILEIIENKC